MSDKSAERKHTIFAVALSLFSERGIKATSMQDIAERCGFSKGTLYQHFRSKEELIRYIHEYAIGMLQEKLESAAADDRSARETLLAQIEVLLHSLIEFKSFMMMQLREREFSGIEDGLHPRREAEGCGRAPHHPVLTTAFVQIRRSLIGIYGAEIDPYSGDLSILISGLSFSYLQLTDDWGMPELPLAEALRHLELALDAAAERMLQLKPKPLVPPTLWADWVRETPEESSAAKRPFILIRQMKDTIAWSPMLRSEREEALETLEVLEAELSDASPRRAVVKGMLGNLREARVLHGALEQLEPIVLYRLDELASS
ncbi:TetR/AcrR family transcriptional regulator [Saccharibacillus alkalitolerans]|uniref:TetR/AcrR family transcriptional regulator n=1 Tax=Saccharibacillus alkalitolerans TaxID=2705290 RepID=A0ABX0F629_9BACL|nr:TetR/AcrR family transcriptional regulator [Saccharibacillus alkalitolerans]NGZ76187.1 TetR/AcrR family transcriptional regulator [Saccharibacillus alkalitolerans]